MEAFSIERAFEAGERPLLAIDTDYGSGDTGQLRTRVQAFLEQLHRR
jgi:benzoyl-CoA reductase/2-hydroxyglutaryl-CoA dehydratase subunit BcrC/BadD/HgdB